MMTLVVLVTTFSLLSLLSIALAGQGGHDGPSGGRGSGYGDLRIEGGRDSGRLEFKDYDGSWGTVCDRGFGSEAGDVACKQMGYRRSDQVLDHQQYAMTSMPIVICDIKCNGDEDQLTDCALQTSCDQAKNGYRSCSHDDDIGISCTNTLDTATIVGIVMGILLFFTIIFVLISLYLCCCWPRCPCFYKNQFYHNEHTALINCRSSSQKLPDDTAFTTYPPPPQQSRPPPPPYNPEDSYVPIQSKGYQTIPPCDPHY